MTKEKIKQKYIVCSYSEDDNEEDDMSVVVFTEEELKVRMREMAADNTGTDKIIGYKLLPIFEINIKMVPIVDIRKKLP
jgi:hypothetical protein